MEKSAAVPAAKGMAFLGVIRFLKDQPQGLALLEKVISSMKVEHQPMFTRKIISIIDYPYAAFINLLYTVASTLAKGDINFIRNLGDYSAIRDYSSIMHLYKINPKPEDLFRDGGVIWKSYYSNAGEFLSIDATPEHSVLHIVNFPEMAPPHCRLMEGWMTQALIQSGGRWIHDIRETKCMSKGDPYHEFTGEWRHIKQE